MKPIIYRRFLLFLLMLGIGKVYAQCSFQVSLTSTLPKNQCFSGNSVHYDLQPQFTIGNGNQVYFIWNHPPPNNIDSGSWSITHTFPKPGKYIPTVVLSSDPCYIMDYLPAITVYAPMAKIENAPISFIADSERYQSSPTNTIHFANNSDTNGLEKVWWVWDMDDAGNANSSSDTQNTNAGKFAGNNTNYSQDWKPVHQYNASASRVYNPTLRMWGIHKEYDIATSAYIYDTCYSENSVALALMKPDAHGLTMTGSQCLGPMPPYGITFNWSQTKPGATQQFVSICFDSACCSSPSDPACWTTQSSFSIPPFSPFAPFPNNYKRPYFSVCDQSGKGWVTVGLLIRNGNESDTVWYHQALRFVKNTPNFTQDQKRYCVNETVVFSPKDSLQDSLSVIRWEFGKYNGWSAIVDSIYRTPGYKRIRYFIEDNVQVSKVDITSTVAENMIPKISYIYKEYGAYMASLTITNVSGCMVERRNRILVGNYASVRLGNPGNATCAGGVTDLLADIHYWHPFGPPIYPLDYDTTSYWLDPTQGGQRPQPAGGYETLEWDFGDGSAVSKNYFEKHTYASAGIYTVELRFKDSTGCMDTVRREVYVNKLVADFGLSSLVSICSKPVQLTDKSYFVSACGSKGCEDSIVLYKWSDILNTFSHIKNPAYVASSTGTNLLNLHIHSANGCVGDTTVTIRSLMPDVKFSVLSDTIGYAPFKATFKNLSDTIATSFGWLIDNASVSTSNDEYTFMQPGDYDVKLSGTGQLYDSSIGAFVNCTVVYPMPPEKAVTIHVLAPNKVADVLNHPQFKLYRVDENNLSLNWENEPVNKVDVYNLLGQQLQTYKNSSANNLLIPTAGLAKGVYLLNIQTAKGLYAEKILVY